MTCPICETEVGIKPDICEVCNWEFVCFTGEPTQVQLEEYNNKIIFHKSKLYSSLGFIQYDAGHLSEALEWFILATNMMCYPKFRQVPLKITQPFDIVAS